MKKTVLKTNRKLTRKEINQVKKLQGNIEKIRKENVGAMIYWDDNTTTYFEDANALMYTYGGEK